ncbi:hypothetical protein FB451DRAFT_133428 [Mycena latifolia]|nr:hypothetical protein FB451DRAFT_133428 [Mycena latifolia]
MWIRTDLTQSRSARIVAYWMVCLSFTSTLWASRMSVIFSVIRIIPYPLKLRKVYRCASDRSWYALEKPQCHLGRAVAVTELFTDLTADLVLAAIPVELLRSVKSITSSQRNLVVIIFAASLLTTAVSIVHAIYLLGPTGLLEGITAQAEAAVSLLVANAAVIVPPVYRLVQKQTDEEACAYAINSEGVVRMQRVNPSGEDSTVVFKHPGLSSTNFGTPSKPVASVN